MDDQQRRAVALKRVKAKREFTTHLAVYVIVNLILVAIWALSGGGYFWPVWTLFGWGIGLAFHAWSVFGERPISESEIEREMGRISDDTAYIEDDDS